MANAPLPWVPDADGLGRLERLALEAVRRGCQTPPQIFAAVAAADTPPQFWGDTTLWCKINGLADRPPPLLHRSSHFSGWVGWRGQRGLGKEDRLKGRLLARLGGDGAGAARPRAVVLEPPGLGR